MESLSFRPGRAFLSVNSPTVPWTVVFEDEGIAAYFYACDRSQQTQEESILDAMLIYNVGSLQKASGSEEMPERLAAVEWSRDGMQAILYLDGTAQALFNFATHTGNCRLNFPNFLPAQGDTWQKASHAWSDEALQQFEAALYA